MKRTPLKRKTPIKQVAITKRRPKKKESTDTRWRCPDYLDWIRSLPCSMCAQGPSEPHHVIGLRLGLSGAGLTAPDHYAMPLCRADHTAIHKDTGMQQCQLVWLRWTLNRGLREFRGHHKVEAMLREALDFIEEKEQCLLSSGYY